MNPTKAWKEARGTLPVTVNTMRSRSAIPRSSICILVLIVTGYSGYCRRHNGLDQDTTIVKLKHNIEKMERLLEKQERRFAVGFDHLKTKVELMNKMATKAESEIYKNHLDQGSCTLPLVPLNGRIVNIDVDTYGAATTLYFVCDDGYHLHGSEVRRCSDNGTWTGEEATCIDIISRLVACSKLKCQNGGVCSKLDDTINDFICQCPQGFYGKRCQKRRKKQQTFKEVVRATCEVIGDRIVCSCLSGYQIGPDHNLCFDIDECANQAYPATDVIPNSVGFTKRHTRNGRPLCGHQCINTAGSYQCICPAGYHLDPTNLRECLDINECEQNLHNCTRNENCFNTGGGFQCVEVGCPPKYIRSSQFVCQRDAESCSPNNRSCFNDAFTYTFIYIDLPSNVKYPADVFQLVADEGSSVNVNRFSVLPGTVSNRFESRKDDPLTGILVLTQPFQGRGPVTVDFELKELTAGKKHRLVEKFIYRITFYTSLYNF